MSAPVVTFIVPCYKLAHFLPECVNSILRQTFSDFEILIMDDCSPDNTPVVAQSFSDSRVKHIRNEANLGHLANYNKGISLARGKYIWLISADDYLCASYVLKRYCKLMDGRLDVGYAFCPGIRVLDGIENDVIKYSIHGSKDRIMAGHQLFKKLVYANTIIAASGMARRECYDQISVFPLDMPWAGDWYLWCRFALYYNVAYFAEPMVAYREHAMSMTSVLMKNGLTTCGAEDVAMPWVLKAKAVNAGYRQVVKACLGAAANEYARSITSQRYKTSMSQMNLEQFEQSLSANTSSDQERSWIRGRVYASLGDSYYWTGDLTHASKLYAAALKETCAMPKIWLKYLLLKLGGLGSIFRRGVRSFRRAFSSGPYRESIS